MVPHVARKVTVGLSAVRLFDEATMVQRIEVRSDTGTATNGNSASNCILLFGEGISEAGVVLRKGENWQSPAGDRTRPFDASKYYAKATTTNQTLMVATFREDS